MKSLLYQPKTRNTIFLVSAAFLVFYWLDLLIYNLNYYFFPKVFVDFLQYISLSYAFPYGTVRGVVFAAILAILALIALKCAPKFIEKNSGSSHRNSFLVIILGFFGYIAWSATRGFLSEAFFKLGTAFNLSGYLAPKPSNIIQNKIWTPSDINVYLDLLDGALDALVFECIYAVMIIILVKKLHLRIWLSVAIVSFLRVLINLGTGQLFAAIACIPLSVFAALYFMRTNRVMPLVFASMFIDFWSWYSTPITWYGSFTSILKLGLVPLLTLVGYILTLTLFPYIMGNSLTAKAANCGADSTEEPC